MRVFLDPFFPYLNLIQEFSEIWEKQFSENLDAFGRMLHHLYYYNYNSTKK